MKKTVIGLLSGFLIFTPYLNQPDYLHYDSKRLLQLCVLGVIGLVLIYKFISKKNEQTDIQNLKLGYSKNLLAGFLILFSAGIISVLLSERFEYALLEYVFFFLLISLLFLLTPVNQKNHLFLGKIIIASAIIYSGLYLMLFFGNYISSFYNPMITLWPEKFDFLIVINGAELKGIDILYFTNMRFLNHTQTWTGPILVGFICYYRNKFSNQWVISALLLLLTSFWWMLIFASGGRGTVLSLVLSAIVLTLIWRKDLIPFLKYGSATFAAGYLFHFLLFELFPNSNESTQLLRTTTTGRLNMWQGAIESWLQNPFFGIGPMHYSKLETIPLPAHPHNFYMQFLLEWGAIAFIALAFLIGFLIKKVLDNYPNKNQKFQSRFLYISVSWALSAALIHALFSGILHTPMSQIWFVLMTGWLIGFNRKSSSVTQSHQLHRYASFAYFALILLTAFLVYDDIGNIYQGYEEYVTNNPGSKFYPRFWGQGLFN